MWLKSAPGVQIARFLLPGTPLGMNETGEPPPLADASWLEDVKRGDSSAFAHLYATHVRAVYWYALRMLKRSEDAEDATHDVFVLAWDKRASIHVVDESILPWLLVCTRNLCLNRLRRSARDLSRRTDEAALENAVSTLPAADAELQNRELAAAITSAVDALTDTDRQLYHLCIDRGLSYADAATALNRSQQSVRSRLFRLRRNLRITLAEQKERLS